MSIDFDDLRRANIARLPLFKDRQGNIAHAYADGQDWAPSDWMTAVAGELGELAGELKKARRGDYGLFAKRCMLHESSLERSHPGDTPFDVKMAIGREIADIVIYLDILAFQFRLDLGEIVAQKFNEVSERIGVDVQLTGCEE
jgi:NTP pyrophosphatase (non-canonical NTP hydrolase)